MRFFEEEEGGVGVGAFVREWAREASTGGTESEALVVLMLDSGQGCS